MNKYPNTFLECNYSYDEADIVLFGAPYDSTTSYRAGTREASRAMRGESIYGMESYSPYQDKDLSEIKVCDDGDLELAFGNSERAMKDISQYVAKVIKDSKIPVMIGGEHLVSLGAMQAIYNKYKSINIIHFDAHIDVKDDILGEKLSHGTVMRRIWDIVGDNRIHQFGIRSGMREEFEWAKDRMFTNKFNLNYLDSVIQPIGDKPVYVTIDLDVFDPSIMSGTGTPEAGGLLFKEMLDAILKISSLNVVGYDIVELCPHLDQSRASTVTACNLVREVLLSINKKS